MRTLIYKRVHRGDPDPATGIFGCNRCMARVRRWPFDAVIGVGGLSREPQQEAIARKLTWVGIGPQEIGIGADGYRLLRFDHFYCPDENGPLLCKMAPALAIRIYEGGVRLIWDTSLSDKEREQVRKILDLARQAPPSHALYDPSQQCVQEPSGERRSNASCGCSTMRKADQKK